MEDARNILSIVPKLTEANDEPSQALIEFLEDMLQSARSGELRGLAGASRMTDGCTYYVMGYARGFDMMGAMDFARLSMAGAFVEGGE